MPECHVGLPFSTLSRFGHSKGTVSCSLNDDYIGKIANDVETQYYIVTKKLIGGRTSLSTFLY